MIALLLAVGLWSGEAAEPVRTWTDASGAFSVDARFVRVEGNTVHLERFGGGKVQIKKSRLSEADLDWLARRSMSPEAQAYLAECDRQRAAEIAKIERQLQKLSEQFQKARRKRLGREKVFDIREKMDGVKTRLDRLKRNAPAYRAALDVGEFKTGDAGVPAICTGGQPRIPTTNFEFRILRVIDEHNVLVVVRSWCREFGSYGPGNPALIQGSAAAFHAEQGEIVMHESDPIWIEGLSTKDFVDGEELALDRPCYVGEPRQYGTTLGKKTVPVLRVIPEFALLAPGP